MARIKKSNIFLKLLHPYSPIIALITGGLVSSFVNEVTIPKEIIFWGLLVWLVFTLVCTHYDNQIKELEKDVDRYKNIIEEKNLQIKNSVGLIEAKYGEFSKYLKKDKYRTLSQKVVEKFPNIDAVLVYKYTIGVKNKNVEIKIAYDTGAEYEGVNIDIIKQNYYIIEKEIYSEFMEIQKMYDDLKSSSLHKDKRMKDAFVEKVINLAIKLNKKNPANYRIFVLLVEMLKDIDKDIDYGKLVERDKENSYRTGILGSILTNNDYIFFYKKRNSDKIDRIYFAFNDIIEGEHKIVILVINNIINEDIPDLIKQVIKYYEDVYNELMN